MREHAALLLVSCCRTNEACINEDICSNAGGDVREGGRDGQKMEMLSKEDREQAECSSMIGFLFYRVRIKS